MTVTVFSTTRTTILLIAAASSWLAAAPQKCPAQDTQPPEVPQSTEAPQSSFSQWLAHIRKEALARGIRQDTVEQAFAGLDEPLAIALENDRAQTEDIVPLETYIAQHVDPERVKTGRQMLLRNRVVLNRVARAYGVPAPMVVAVWGLESNFGRFSPVHPTIAVLATLAWDPRRSSFFREELMSALEILDRGDIELSRMRGSWAGAMGQLQFMPSSYLKYAVDFDGDGRPDIWDSRSDIFASIAYYLKEHGWVAGNRWGREVNVPRDLQLAVPAREEGCQAKRAMTVPRTLSEWRRLGIRLPGGRPLPQGDVPASLVSGTSRHFLVYGNYDALLAYNCAHAYALSVALLADRMAN